MLHHARNLLVHLLATLLVATAVALSLVDVPAQADALGHAGERPAREEG